MEATQIFVSRWIDKDNVVYTYNGMLFNSRKEENPAICDNMDKSGGYVKWHKPVIEGQILHDTSHMRYLK